MGARRIAVFAVPALILYMTWGTGIHSDDYPYLRMAQQLDWRGYLLPDLSAITVLIFGPFSYYFDFFPYFAFGSHFLPGYDLYKFLTAVTCVGLTYCFATDYLPRERALLVACLFVLLPIHDSTLYWNAALIYALAPALILFAHHLVRHKNYIAGSFLSLFGAFATYASPPYTFGLGLIFLIEREWKKAVCFMTPGVIYVAYYFSVSRLPGVSKGRIQPDLQVSTFAKQYLLQLGSFLDTAIGPSFWLKLWYSASAITLLSLLVGALAFGLFAVNFKAIPIQAGKKYSLFGGLFAVLALAFAMFALTGFYPQMAFNLGNRVVVYGALLLSFLIVFLPLKRAGFCLIAAALLLSALGLSDHWKAWNLQQQAVMDNIRKNPDLAALGNRDLVLVAGNSFSKLGPFGHIDFFSETSIAGSAFIYSLGDVPVYKLHSISRRYRYTNGELIDRKYGERIAIDTDVVIYESEKDTVLRMPAAQLDHYLSGLPVDVRHWIQLLGDGPLKSTILALMPRLGYLFDT